MKGQIIVTKSPMFKVGDPSPDGYIARHEWAAVHMKAGLKQQPCCKCTRWFFPHELSDRIIIQKAFRGRTFKTAVAVEIPCRVCKECEA